MFSSLLQMIERITTIARCTMLENSRKHVFHVLMIAALAVICVSTLLSCFTLGVQIKILKDLSVSSIILCGGLLAVALASGGIPSEIEQRTLYPVLARPVNRAELLMGKYFGTLATVYSGLLIISFAFAIVLLRHGGSIDIGLFAAIAFAMLEVAVIAAVATLLSIVATPAVAGMLSLLIYICGTIKMGYLHHLGESAGGAVAKGAFFAFYHLLPNLECFNFKDMLVHNLPVPGIYMVQVAIYGFVYSAVVLAAATEIFARREL
jgi:Cu-processing system permease protein